MSGERWLLATPDGACGQWKTKTGSEMVVFIEAGKICLQIEDDHYDTHLPVEQAKELAVEVLVQQGVIARGALFKCLVAKPWQKFVLGDQYDAGVTVVAGRVEFYPADSSESVWGTRQFSRELALQVLAQQCEEIADTDVALAALATLEGMLHSLQDRGDKC